MQLTKHTELNVQPVYLASFKKCNHFFLQDGAEV